VVDEVGDRTLLIAGQIIVFKQQPAFQRERPALGHRMIGLATHVAHRLTLYKTSSDGFDTTYRAPSADIRQFFVSCFKVMADSHLGPAHWLALD